MTEENDTKGQNNSERRQKDRRKVSVPVDDDRRKTQRRTDKNRRQKP